MFENFGDHGRYRDPTIIIHVSSVPPLILNYWNHITEPKFSWHVNEWFNMRLKIVASRTSKMYGALKKCSALIPSSSALFAIFHAANCVDDVG